MARVDARRGAEQEQGGRFRQAMWRTSNAPLRHGNAIGLLKNGPAAYEDWLAAIGSARRWVHLENYIFADDSVGHRFADALCEKATRVVIQEPGRARVLCTLEVLLAAADRRMWIADAYFLSAPTLTQALISAARDGVDVRILLPATNDVRWVGALSRAGYRPLLEAGVRIFEYGGPMMHAKTHVVDGRFSRVGSTNLNVSGLLANWEADLMVEDPTFGAQMDEMFEEDLENAREVRLDGTPGARRPRPTPERNIGAAERRDGRAGVASGETRAQCRLRSPG